jgi:LysR family transcriptional activator of nhaA
METLNYKHLHCFWSVAQAGSLTRAAEKLGVTPQTLSEQLKQLELHVGTALFTRNGRGLQLTETGRLVAGYADEMFTLGHALEDALRDRSSRATLFRVGVCDVVPKSIAYGLLQPALAPGKSVRLVCREGPLDDLLAQLAANRLDLVVTDTPMPDSAAVRGFNHVLGQCTATIFGTKDLAQQHPGTLPGMLQDAPFLIPGEHSTLRARLVRHFADARVQPRIVGEFDDTALLKAFGEAGAGFFAGPTAIAGHIARQYNVRVIGELPSLTMEYFAISIERKLTHPMVLRIAEHARNSLFGMQRG